MLIQKPKQPFSPASFSLYAKLTLSWLQLHLKQTDIKVDSFLISVSAKKCPNYPFNSDGGVSVWLFSPVSLSLLSSRALW